MIVFARKVQDVRASKGYFVARRFTRDAIAQAKRDDVELLTADDVVDTLPPFLDTFRILGNQIITTGTITKLIMLQSSPQAAIPPSGMSMESFVKCGTEDMLLGKLVEKLQHQVVDEYTNHLPSATMDEGKRRYEHTKTVGYGPGELMIEGRECIALELHVVWETKIIRHPIVSTFDIKTRGRVITVATDDSPFGGSLQISFISTE